MTYELVVASFFALRHACPLRLPEASEGNIQGRGMAVYRQRIVSGNDGSFHQWPHGCHRLEAHQLID